MDCLETKLLPVSVAKTSQGGHSVMPKSQESVYEDLLQVGHINAFCLILTEDLLCIGKRLAYIVVQCGVLDGWVFFFFF